MDVYARFGKTLKAFADEYLKDIYKLDPKFNPRTLNDLTDYINEKKKLRDSLQGKNDSRDFKSEWTTAPEYLQKQKELDDTLKLLKKVENETRGELGVKYNGLLLVWAKESYHKYLRDLEKARQGDKPKDYNSDDWDLICLQTIKTLI